jgi:hypothetical protein
MARPPSSPSLKNTKMIVIETSLTVQSYLELFANGCPDNLRPVECPFCKALQKLHRHGHYKRMVFTLEEAYSIPIFRFKCPICGKTTSLLPPFIGEKEQTAWEVQEEVVRQQIKGQSLTQVAGELKAAGGPYSEKSLWRWTTRWNRLLRDSGNIFWTQILRILPHIQLPVGKMKPRTEWGWLFKIWDKVKAEFGDDKLFNLLYRQQKSMALAPG